MMEICHKRSKRLGPYMPVKWWLKNIIFFDTVNLSIYIFANKSMFLFSGKKVFFFSFFTRFIASEWPSTLILKLGPRINCLCLTHGDRPKLNKHSYAKRVLITRQYIRSSNVHNTYWYIIHMLKKGSLYWKNYTGVNYSAGYCRVLSKSPEGVMQGRTRKDLMLYLSSSKYKIFFWEGGWHMMPDMHLGSIFFFCTDSTYHQYLPVIFNLFWLIFIFFYFSFLFF